jgi:hypothetical protein
MSETFDGMRVEQTDPSFKLVHGLCEFDGALYWRWGFGFAQKVISAQKAGSLHKKP